MPKRHEYIELQDVPLTATETADTRPCEKSSTLTQLRRRFQGWRAVISLGILLITLVLLANIVLLVLSIVSPRDADGLAWNGLLYKGNCTQSQNVTRYLHLLVNILGTVLLAASNAALHIAASPTRKEIDDAHAAGQWLHIGIFGGLRNLRFTPYKRAAICIVLGLSSVPFHFVYNSSIFYNFAAYDYAPILVSDDFAKGHSGRFDSDFLCATDKFCSALSVQMINDYINTTQHALQSGENQLLTLDPVACQVEFTKTIVSNYRGLTLVLPESLNANLTSNSVAGVVQLYLDDPDNAQYIWMNSAQFAANRAILDPLDPWLVETLDSQYVALTHAGEALDILFGTETPIDHCIALPGEEQCTVVVNRMLIAIIVACNIGKLVCLISLLRLERFSPLTTVGDAVADFLRDEDVTTRGQGPISFRDIRQGRWRNPHRLQKQWPQLARTGSYWTGARPRWINAVSTSRWVWICFLLFASSLCALVPSGIYSAAVTPAWKWTDFEQVASYVSQATPELGLGGALILANLPQLVVSGAYLLFNSLLSSMVVGAEFADYATTRKTLRVSHPVGHQRSTYWLSLPYKYSFPFMALLAVLHFFVSEGVYMIRIYEFGPDQSFLRVARSTVGWTPAPVFYSAIMMALITLILMALGMERFNGKVPIFGTCSAAISAACHRAGGEGPEVAAAPIMYGVLPDEEAEGMRVVGFSAGPVEQLVKGEHYV